MPINDWNEPNYWLSTMTLGGKVRPLDIMVALEKENIELVTQEELDNDPLKKEEFDELEPARIKLKTKLETYGLESGEFGEEAEEENH